MKIYNRICFGIVFALGVSVTAFAKTDLKEVALQEAMAQVYPLSPAQIKDIKKIGKENEKANFDELEEPVSRDIPVNVLPSQMKEPTLIRLSGQGITSLQFKSLDGEIWPVEQYNIANSNQVDVMASKNNRILMLKAKQSYFDSTMVVILKGLDTPITLRLVNWQSQWDYAVFLRIQAYQNKAKAQERSAPKAAPDYLMALLGGVPPQGAKRLLVKGDKDTSAWVYGGKMLLLTQATLLSPQYQAKMDDKNYHSTTHAYELPSVTPIVYLSKAGRQIKLEITADSKEA